MKFASEFFTSPIRNWLNICETTVKNQQPDPKQRRLREPKVVMSQVTSKQLFRARQRLEKISFFDFFSRKGLKKKGRKPRLNSHSLAATAGTAADLLWLRSPKLSRFSPRKRKLRPSKRQFLPWTIQVWIGLFMVASKCKSRSISSGFSPPSFDQSLYFTLFGTEAPTETESERPI